METPGAQAVNNIAAPEEKKPRVNPLRPNLLVLAGMAWLLAVALMICAFYLVYRLLIAGPDGEDGVSKLDIGIVVGVVTLAITVISGTLSSLLSLAGQVAQPEPKDQPPQVPADTLRESIHSNERVTVATLTGTHTQP